MLWSKRKRCKCLPGLICLKIQEVNLEYGLKEFKDPYGKELYKELLKKYKDWSKNIYDENFLKIRNYIDGLKCNDRLFYILYRFLHELMFYKTIIEKGGICIYLYSILNEKEGVDLSFEYIKNKIDKYIKKYKEEEDEGNTVFRREWEL